jgi:rhodanese-related sulfurtransferase
MSEILTRASLLLLAATLLGLSANQLSPRGIPLLPASPPAVSAAAFLPLGEARKLWGGGVALFLDARDPLDFAAGHIGNALNLPAKSFDTTFAAIAPMLTPASELVLYCDGQECDLSHELAQSLRARGYTNLHLLQNGWTAWKEAGFPVAIKK